jgi:hypothetical protein
LTKWKNRTPESCSDGVLGKHDKLPAARKVRKHRESERPPQAGPAMRPKNEELGKPIVAGRRHEGKGWLANECESDRHVVVERDERSAKGVLKPVRKMIGLPVTGRCKAILVSGELREIMNVERINVSQPVAKVGCFTGIGEDYGSHGVIWLRAAQRPAAERPAATAARMK